MKNEKQNLCADAGDAPKQVIIDAGYTPHIRPRGEEKQAKLCNPLFEARRWIVESCHSWFNRFRKLIVRFEKLNSIHLALDHLTDAVIAL